jgi:capsular polysaccharide transport system permease protein
MSVPGAGRTPLRRSIAIQARVVSALMMREVITRFGRRNLGALWLVAEPMLFTLGVTALWTLIGARHASNIPIVAFAITGYSSVLMWRNTVSRCCSAIEQNFNLLYHRNVRVLDVFLSRIVLEAGGATASFAVLALFFGGIGWIGLPEDPLKVVAGWLMLTWFGASLALFVGALTSFHDVIDRLWHPTSYLLFPLSGAAFMVDWLPPAGREAVLLLPMVHGVELLREGYFGSLVRTHHDIGYMATANLALMFAGLFLLRDASRRVEAR